IHLCVRHPKTWLANLTSRQHLFDHWVWWLRDNWPECRECFYDKNGEFALPFDHNALTSWLPGSAKLGKNNILIPFVCNGGRFEKLDLTETVFLDHLVCLPGDEGGHLQEVPSAMPISSSTRSTTATEWIASQDASVQTCCPEAFEEAPETVVDAYFDYSSKAADFFDDIVEVMNELKDVNRSWRKYQVVVYTPSITVGVSFDIPNHFHSIFVFAGTQSCTVRDMIQACFQIRHLESKTIYYHLAPPRFLKRYCTMTIEQTRTFVEKLIKIEQVSLEQPVYDTVLHLDWHKTSQWLQNVCCGNVLEHHLSQSFCFSALFHCFFAETGFTPGAMSFHPPEPKSGRVPIPIKLERLAAKFLSTETITQGQASYINEKLIQRRDVTPRELDELNKFNFVKKFDADFANFKSSTAQPIMADLYAKKGVMHQNYVNVLSLFCRGVFDASLGDQRALVGFAEFQDSDMLRIRFGALFVQYLGFESIFDTKDVLQEVTKDNPRLNTIIAPDVFEQRTSHFIETHRSDLENLFNPKELVKGKNGANTIFQDLGVFVESVSSDPKVKGVRQKGWQLVNRIEAAYLGYRIRGMLQAGVEQDKHGDSQDSQDSGLDVDELLLDSGSETDLKSDLEDGED
ncbi:hypothetical protein HK102_001438, partial [Quaeritorhiza haematococci]